jgi:nickel-dependent lactate racemase
MPELAVPWGDGKLAISTPDDWQLLRQAEPTLRPAPADWAERLALALGQTASDRPLAQVLGEVRHGRVCIVVEDLTRDSPLREILPVILREIAHAGIRDDQIEFFFANGMHPQMTGPQAVRKLGDLAGRFAWRSNRYDDAEAHASLGRLGGVDVLVDRGVAEADLRIIVSSVSPHLQAGFGGGYKMVFPGCSHMSTIQGLHRKGLGHRPRQLVGMEVTANPMRRLIDAAGEQLDARHGSSFAVQYLLDGANLPTFIAAGSVLATHRMLAKQCSVACGVVLGERADVLVTNAHPRDLDLWQSFKCIANTRWAARPNGVIICLARCPAGLDGMKVPSWPVSAGVTRGIVRWVGPSAIGSMVTRLVPRLASDAAFFVRMATQAVARNPIYIVSPNLHDAGVKFPGVPVFAGVDEAFAAAAEHLGGGPQRVVVFPSGGITFPVPAPAPMARLSE